MLPHAGQVATCRYRAATGPARHPQTRASGLLEGVTHRQGASHPPKAVGHQQRKAPALCASRSGGPVRERRGAQWGTTRFVVAATGHPMAMTGQFLMATDRQQPARLEPHRDALLGGASRRPPFQGPRTAGRRALARSKEKGTAGCPVSNPRSSRGLEAAPGGRWCDFGCVNRPGVVRQAAASTDRSARTSLDTRPGASERRRYAVAVCLAVCRWTTTTKMVFPQVRATRAVAQLG